MLGWIIEPIARRVGRCSVETSLREFDAAVRKRYASASAVSGGGVRPSGVGLRQALTRRLDGVLAWARPGGGAGRGDDTRGSGARKVICVSYVPNQGCQYTSVAFGLRCCEAGVRPSMGSVAMPTTTLCESFFATLESELLDRRRFATQVEARLAVFEYIEADNSHRRHSAPDYESPIS